MAGYGALFDQVNSDGNTPLHNAAEGGHGMALKFLGQRGINLMIVTEWYCVLCHKHRELLFFQVLLTFMKIS